MKQNRNRVKNARIAKKEERGRVIKGKFVEARANSIQPLQAKSDSQKVALKAFTEKQLVILSGTAGSGKTEMMCWWASKLWLEGKVNNIVICRPYQQLGNDYGAITGNDAMKLMPYCMSMLMKFKRYLGVGVLRNNFRMEVTDILFNEVSGINILPVEKVQGMSFGEDTIILADEVQNCTPAQVKALVTRLEEGCQIICAGDPSQSAIKGENGLTVLQKVLQQHPHEDSQTIHFTPDDNCRSGISGHLANIFEQQGGW